MRALYKALASVGMIALSTAAALGVRHLSKASKKRKEARENEEQPVQDIDFIDEDEARKEAEQAADADDSDKDNSDDVDNKSADDNEVTVAETEIKSDQSLDA